MSVSSGGAASFTLSVTLKFGFTPRPSDCCALGFASSDNSSNSASSFNLIASSIYLSTSKFSSASFSALAVSSRLSISASVYPASFNCCLCSCVKSASSTCGVSPSIGLASSLARSANGVTASSSFSSAPAVSDILLSATSPRSDSVFPRLSDVSEVASSSAHTSVGDTSRVKPSIQDTKPIVSFLVPYFGFFLDPSSFFCSIRSVILDLSLIHYLLCFFLL